MYRLLKIKGAPTGAYPKLSLQTFSRNSEALLKEETCISCRMNNFSKAIARHQSTITHPNPSPKQRKARTKKRFADLIIVKDNNLVQQQKTTIKKLTSDDLKLLASSNLNLNELYKLNEMSLKSNVVEEHSYSNLTFIDTVPSENLNINKTEETTKIEPIIPNIELEFDEEIEPSINIQPEFSEDDIMTAPNMFNPAEFEVPDAEELPDIHTRQAINNQQYKEEVINKTLAAFVEICTHLNQPQKGLGALYWHRNKKKRITDLKNLSINNIDIYNILVKGFAARGQFDKMQEVMRCMEEENLEKNVQTYAAIIGCLGRINFHNNNLRNIRVYANEAARKGITFDKMLDEGIFLGDERQQFLKAAMACWPTYVPHLSPPKVQYKNHLVDVLNNVEQLKPNKRRHEESNGIFTKKFLTQKVEEQVEAEINGTITIKSIECDETPSAEVLGYRAQLDDLYKTWEVSARAAFERDLAALTAQKGTLNFEPYLRCIPVKEFVKIIIAEAKKLAEGSETYSPTVNMICRGMGQKVYARYQILRKQKTGVMEKVLKIHNHYCSEYAAGHGGLGVVPGKEVLVNSRQQWQWASYRFKGEGATLEMGHQEWTPTDLATIGKFLHHIIMYDLKVDVNSMKLENESKNYLPAFYTIFRFQNRLTKEEVKPHPVLSKLYRASKPETLSFPTNEVPMKCPPKPWLSVKSGGYLISPSELVRLPPGASLQMNKLANVDPEQTYPSLDALNQLSAVPWKVNKKILDVILEVFTKGGDSKLDVPESSLSLPPVPFSTPDMDKTQKYQLFKQRLQYKRKKAEMHSMWCDCLYRLSLANHFKDDIFWLPHNMDFRGRVYPIPPHLSHLGSDLARSMLVFAESRPLGPKGLDWLKIHLINLTGLKKRDPIEERLKYADQVMDLILDSADNPLTGKRWWAESDEPWQTLAACMEVAQATRSPNPEKYRSSFPIHQDGSCNGLQHYAALGRDLAGAFSVNLRPSECPQDVYSAVVALVEEQRKKDAANGLEIAQHLDGFIKRKVIKQTIMTTVYGVTRFGARLQIAKQLKDIDDFPKVHLWTASHYLTSKTFESLKTMFTSTREIQDWFTDCARMISSVNEKMVEWVTPLGLPIVQPYVKHKKFKIGTFNSFSVDTYEKPHVMKQKNAFPPNFIHSLDSSHMMLTSLFAERKGITFVSVHDCYWTHPSTVHIMNKICREQFVALHSEPILKNLSDFLASKYSFDERSLYTNELAKRKVNMLLRQLPRTGSFNIKDVLDSVYFFS